jgi:fermentation-respiration switch protein FrsA (DUF1100 family)
MLTVGWVTLAIAVMLGLLWLFQRNLIYLPSQEVLAPPVDVEEVTYETEDGLILTGWYLQAQDQRGSVIVFNGNAGNRSHRLSLGEALVAAGHSVLLTDYRGYGGNPSSPSEEGLGMDARAARQYLRVRAPGSPIAYFGESLGAAVAVDLAVEEPPVALILRSPWTSLSDVAGVHYPYLPASLLLRDRYPSLDRISAVNSPLLVIAGTEDTIVPISQSRQIYEAAGEPKQLLIIEGAGHNDSALLNGEEMIQRTAEFLGEA